MQIWLTAWEKLIGCIAMHQMDHPSIENFHEPIDLICLTASSATKKAWRLLFLCGRQSHPGCMIDGKRVFDLGQCSNLTTSTSTSVFFQGAKQAKHADSGM